MGIFISRKKQAKKTFEKAFFTYGFINDTIYK